MCMVYRPQQAASRNPVGKESEPEGFTAKDVVPALLTASAGELARGKCCFEEDSVGSKQKPSYWAYSSSWDYFFTTQKLHQITAAALIIKPNSHSFHPPINATAIVRLYSGG